jgi:hypothetical protein
MPGDALTFAAPRRLQFNVQKFKACPERDERVQSLKKKFRIVSDHIFRFLTLNIELSAAPP